MHKKFNAGLKFKFREPARPAIILFSARVCRIISQTSYPKSLFTPACLPIIIGKAGFTIHHSLFPIHSAYNTFVKMMSKMGWLPVFLFVVVPLKGQGSISASDSFMSVLSKKPGIQYQKYTPYYIQTQYGSISDSLAGAKLEQILVRELFPFWYGTPWDFNGYTSVPNKGVIACGYFVSTTLEHAGMVLNRYSLAQKGPGDEARIISCGDSVTYLETDRDSFIRYCTTHLKNGLYFMGLKFHVGYLYKKDSLLYVVHSNYMEPSVVMIQNAHDAEVLNQGEFHLTNITHNYKLINRWKLRKKINS